MTSTLRMLQVLERGEDPENLSFKIIQWKINKTMDKPEVFSKPENGLLGQRVEWGLEASNWKWLCYGYWQAVGKVMEKIKEIINFQGLGEGKLIWKAQRIPSNMKPFLMTQWGWIHILVYLSKPTEHKAPTENPTVNDVPV